MDSSLLPGVILLVVFVSLVIAAVFKDKALRDESPRKHRRTPTRPSLNSEQLTTHPHDHPWAFGLLGLALVVNMVLGYLVYGLHQDLRSADAAIEAAVSDGEEAIQVALSQALAAIPDTRDLETSLDQQARMNTAQEATLTDHERRLRELAASEAGSLNASNIEVPFFCSGEIAIWSSGFGRGLTC